MGPYSSPKSLTIVNTLDDHDAHTIGSELTSEIEEKIVPDSNEDQVNPTIFQDSSSKPVVESHNLSCTHETKALQVREETERNKEDPPPLVLESKEDKRDSTFLEDDHEEKDKDEDDTPFKPYTLQDIRNEIHDLAKQVPKASKAANIDYTCPTQVREWGESIERLTDQYYLLIYCVSSATYKWNGKRSGAEDQNLGYLDRGIETANNMIIHAVEKDMSTDTLAPRKFKILSKKVESEDKKTGGNETKYIYKDNTEEEFVWQQYTAKKLSRNAPLQRHLLLTAFDLTCRCIDDYLEASQKDDEVVQYDYLT